MLVLGGALRILAWVMQIGLRSCKDKVKMVYKLATMAEDRYPKQLFSQEWIVHVGPTSFSALTWGSGGYCWG